MINEEFCFVLMPFSEELSGVYQGAIKPAVESQGLKCIRADEVEDPGNLIKRTIEYIRKAKLIIADLTGKSPNVFYEIGIAHSFGNNTIMIAQDIKDVPFDVHAYHVILYENTIVGGNKLRRGIEKKIGSLPKWSISSNNPVQEYLPDQIVSIGQYTNTVNELNETKGMLMNAQKHLQDFENVKRDYAEIKENYKIAWEKAKELEILNKLIGPLFLGPSKVQQPGEKNLIERVQEVVERLDQKGQVSLDVSTSQNDNQKKKIIFTRIQ
jgi:hypothetical protein